MATGQMDSFTIFAAKLFFNKLSLICFAISSINTVLASINTLTELKRLQSDLLQDYDRHVRPVKNESAATDVKLLFDVRYVISLDEKYQILTVKGILMMQWTDEHLTWNPASYSSISSIQFSSDEVWVPDVYSIYNVKAVDIYNQRQWTPIIIYSNGSAKWYPQAVFDVPCNTQFRHYPFDSHNCSILFAAWSHMGDAIALHTVRLPLTERLSLEGTEWTVTGVAHENDKIEIAQYTYPQVRVRIYLQRASRIYRYICVIPTLISILSSLFGFWLLPHETARYAVACSNIIMLSFLLQHLAVTVHAGKTIPILAEYCAACLCMSAAFLLVTVVTNLLRESTASPPTVIVRLAHSTLDRYLCLFSFSAFSSQDKVLTDVTSNATHEFERAADKNQKDWICVSLVVDRLLFWIFVIIYVVLLSVLAAV